MSCEDMVRVLRDADVEVKDQPVLPSALGLPDGARLRLLVDHEDLFRVYCAENLSSTLPIARVKGALKAARDEALLILARGVEHFVALHTTAEGEDAQVELDRAEILRLLPNVKVGEGEDAYEVSERVRDLILHPEEERKPYLNRGLFSDDYLDYRLTDPFQYPEWGEGVSHAYGKLQDLYESKKQLLDGLNEAQTESEFLDEALDVLGYSFIKQTRARDGSRPDYALFADAKTKDEALRVQDDPTRLYAATLAVAEGKYWGRNLDVYTKRDDRDNEATASQKSAPGMQISRYLQQTDLPWGILTNGSEWRLYYGGAPGKTERYYAVDLVRALEREDDFRRFYLFFRRDAFVPKGAEGKTFLDRVLAGSEDYAVRVGNNLKKVVFERLFARLAAGFLEDHTLQSGQPADEETLKKTYRGTLALLYRLLFLLYAEARDLLPHRDRLGYGRHSITRLKKDVAEGIDEGERFAGNSYVIWERLESLFRIVDDGSTVLNVPPYNGGLFKDAGSHEFLGTHRVSDRHLAPALDELSRQPDEDGKKRFVDYAFIGVRELGSVYEGLLEFSLRIAERDLVVVKEKGKEVYVPKGSQGRKRVLGSVKKGEPYLVNDKKERKATGAYYTPRYIVDYIVENTLGPLVEERRAALEERLAEIARLQSDLRRMRMNDDYIASEVRKMEPLKTLLDVKVLDPAMGSGHFLVAAVDYLTDEFSRIISELDAEPVVEELAELRAEIRASLEAYRASATDEQLSDANLLKRMVLKRCVYGVDLNEMAVELAKLSLWLDAFTVGAPLSFLDHHLKHGNSLIGSSVPEVRRELEGSGSLSGTAFEGLLSGAGFMHELEENPDATITQVKESASLYAMADETLDPIKQIMDVWTSKHFDNAFAETVLKDELSTKNFPELRRGNLSSFSDRGRKVFEIAADLRASKGFFHCELEFPEVFYESVREKENPGFDAVIGNPPYGIVFDVPTKEYLEKVLTGFIRNNDLYAAFSEKSVRLLRINGFASMIVPNTFIMGPYYNKLKEVWLEQTRILFIDDFGYATLFPDPNVFSSVFLCERSSEGDIQETLLRDALVESDRIYHTHVDSVLLDTLPLERWKPFSPVTQETSKTSLPLSQLSDVKDVGFNYWTKGRGKVRGGSIGSRVLYDGPQEHRDDTPFIKGGDFDRYVAPSSREHWLRRDYELRLDPVVDTFRFSPKFLRVPRKIIYRQTSDTVIAALDDKERLVDKTVHVIVLRETASDYSHGYLLAILNSRLTRHIYADLAKEEGRTFAQVKTFRVKQLPVRRIEFITSADKREALRTEGQALYDQFRDEQDFAPVLDFVDRCLARLLDGTPNTAKERSDVVHDLLVYLAEEMISMHEKRVELEHTWREWVEAILPPNHQLTKTFLEQEWIEIGLQSGWEGAKAEFQARNAIPSGKALQDLKRETEEALEELRPLYERIQRTDELIDRIVYRLYGLTEDEISVVEASVERG